MKKCNNCGFDNQDNDKFCNNCWAVLVSNDKKEKVNISANNLEKNDMLIKVSNVINNFKIKDFINNLKTKDYKSILEQNKNYIDLWKKIILPIIAIVVLYFVWMYAYNNMYYNYIPKKWDILVDVNKEWKYDIDSLIYINTNTSNLLDTSDYTNNNDNIRNLKLLLTLNDDDYTYNDLDFPSWVLYKYYKLSRKWYNSFVKDNDVIKDKVNNYKELKVEINEEKTSVLKYVSSLNEKVKSLYSTKIFKKLNSFTKKNTVVSTIFLDDYNKAIHFIENWLNDLNNWTYSDSSDNSWWDAYNRMAEYQTKLEKTFLPFIFIWKWLSSLESYRNNISLILFALDKENDNTYKIRFKIKLYDDSDNNFYSRIKEKICIPIKSSIQNIIGKVSCDISISKKELNWNIILNLNMDKLLKKEDTEIKANLSMISTALEMYFNDEGEYPEWDIYSLKEKLVPTYLQDWPIDNIYFYAPFNKESWSSDEDGGGFISESNNNWYILWAQMENPDDCNIKAYSKRELEKLIKDNDTIKIRKLLHAGNHFKDEFKKWCYYVLANGY